MHSKKYVVECLLHQLMDDFGQDIGTFGLFFEQAVFFCDLVQDLLDLLLLCRANSSRIMLQLYLESVRIVSGSLPVCH